MKKFFSVLIVLVIFLEMEKVSAGEVSCESIGSQGWNVVGSVKVCSMQKTTINAPGFTISSAKDETITGLYFYGNKKIIFLPERVAEKFLKLVGLNAQGCSIRTISKKNFEGMKNLRALFLEGNQIEKIQTGTFDDLISLERLDLNGNKIQFLNSEVFRNLHKLKDVRLYRNECINEDFNGVSLIALLRQKVAEKCSFCEDVLKSNTNCEILEKIEDVDKNTQKTLAEIANIKSSNKIAESCQKLTENVLIGTKEESERVLNMILDQQKLSSEIAAKDNERLSNETEKIASKTKTMLSEQMKNIEKLINEKEKSTIYDLTTKLIKLELEFKSSMEVKIKEISELEAKIKAKDAKIAELEKEFAEIITCC